MEDKSSTELNDFCVSGQNAFVRAVELHKAGQLHEAEILYQRVLEGDPRHLDANHNLGVMALQADKPLVSLAYFKTALQINSQNQQYWLSYIAALIKFGQTKEAESVYIAAFANGICGELMEAFEEKLLKKSTDPATFLNRLGISLMEQGKFSYAEIKYLKALNFRPDSDGLYNNLGNAIKEQGRLDEAEKNYRLALKLSPNFAAAYNNLGNVQKDQGKLSEAEVSYRKALVINPKFGEVLNNLGVVFMEQRRLILAKNNFSRALEIDPDCSNAHSNLGIVYSHLGCMEQATTEFSAAAILSPNQSENFINLGDALRFTDKVNQEIAAYQKAWEIDPNDLGLGAAVWLAVRSYLARNFEQFSSILNDTCHLSGAKDTKYKVASIYWTYLDELRKWHVESSQLTQEIENDQSLLYVIGESHSLSAHGILVKVDKKLLRCEAQWIAGCKQWHLGNYASNRYKHKFELVIKNIPSKSSVLLTIGEIDCRPDDGIVKAARKYPKKTLDDIINETINGYISYLTKMVVIYDHKFIVCGVPALNTSMTITNEVQIIQHGMFMRKFNSILKEDVLKAGMCFLDVFALTDRGDGLSNEKWHIDSTHLKPSAYQNAFDNNFLI